MREKCEQRLKNLMVIDNNDSCVKVDNIVKAEMYYVLKNYLEIIDNSMELTIDVQDGCVYNINFKCLGRGIKNVKCL